MRPLRLDMEGFATFAKHSTIDFTDAEFFALVGPTGAGKSTVLDAICFALYGRAPRWGSGIEYALAPSATSGKVRLVFRADSRVYVATRVVRRGGTGKVTTASAALERLPDDTDPTDLGDIGSLIGTALAGSAKAVGEQVERIIGLPFDQFTKCVLLPQGAFAEFLHSSSAERRKILENLLGYSVYRDIQGAAGEEHKAAEALVTFIDSQLAALPAVTDEDLTAAEERTTELDRLATRIRDRSPELDDVAGRVAAADRTLAVVDEEHALLTYIRQPADIDVLTRDLAEATEAVATARTAVADAEATEDRLRVAVADADPAAIEARLAEHARLAELADRIETGSRFTEEARQKLDLAQRGRRADAAAVAEAERAVQEATTADLAAALRHDLHAGDDCPVCHQPVAEIPRQRVPTDLAAARELLRQRQSALVTADERLTEAQRTVDRYSGQLDHLVTEHDQLTKTVEQAPTVERLRAELADITERRTALTEAGEAVRVSRDTLRRKESALAKVNARMTGEWQKFDHHRDRVARLSPPAADRSDLADAWRVLAEWAGTELDQRRRLRAEHSATLTRLRAETDAVRDTLTGLLARARVPVPPTDAAGSAFVDAVVTAQREASHRLEQLRQQRAQYITLTEQRSGHLRRSQVAKQLHQHLGARQFVNWLLSEALDELVAGASEKLRTLTSGQYDLTYDNRHNDFYVVDHHDADLTRPVKTLSGGETFTAALALALAMSEQLAGMSTRGACLESILLDEGFGTLDAATLDQVAANLESLSGSGDRMVGVVTHVSGLAERIPVRFAVSKDAHGSHVERSEA